MQRAMAVIAALMLLFHAAGCASADPSAKGEQRAIVSSAEAANPSVEAEPSTPVPAVTPTPKPISTPSPTPAPTPTPEPIGEKEMQMTINGRNLSVSWEENASVEALKELAAAGPLTIQTQRYGGFEQVGSLGSSLTRNDVQTTTAPGDIVLYSGNSMVIFYGSNSWAYTRLGRITGMSAEELTALLSGDACTVVVTLK